MPQPQGQPTAWDELEDLVPRLQSADEDAFLSLEVVLSVELFRWFRRSFSEADARDCVQTLLLKVFLGIRKYRRKAGGGLRAWVYQIARTVKIDRFRKAEPMDPRNVEADAPCVLNGKAASGVKPDWSGREVEIQDPRSLNRRLLIDNALAHLPEIDQEILYLRYFADGLSADEREFGEIAKTVGMVENNVRQRHKRALAKLRSLMVENTAAVGGR